MEIPAPFCETCGKPIDTPKPGRRFCRPSCRAKAGLKRHDEKIRREACLPFPAHDSATQCDRLLDALRRGPVTNGQMLYELRIGNHTGRISDLRRLGHRIEKILQDHHTGLTVYALLAPQQGEIAL